MPALHERDAYSEWPHHRLPEAARKAPPGAPHLGAPKADLPRGIEYARVIFPAQQHLMGGTRLGRLEHEVLPQTDSDDARDDQFLGVNLVRAELALATEHELLPHLRRLEGRSDGGNVGLLLHPLQPGCDAIVHDGLFLGLILGCPVLLRVVECLKEGRRL